MAGEARREGRAATVAPLGPGSLVGERYRLQRRLGDGALGVTWLALDERSGNTVVFKSLKPWLSVDRNDPTLVKRLQAAVRGIAGVQHSAFPPMLDVIAFDGPEGRQLGLTRAQITGVPLNELWADGAIDAGFALGVLQRIAEALFALQSSGRCHGNLSARNVFVSAGDDGRPNVVITDAGLRPVVVGACGPATVPNPLYDEGIPTPADDVVAAAKMLLEVLRDVKGADARVPEVFAICREVVSGTASTASASAVLQRIARADGPGTGIPMSAPMPPALFEEEEETLPVGAVGELPSAVRPRPADVPQDSGLRPAPSLGSGQRVAAPAAGAAVTPIGSTGASAAIAQKILANPEVAAVTGSGRAAVVVETATGSYEAPAPGNQNGRLIAVAVIVALLVMLIGGAAAMALGGAYFASGPADEPVVHQAPAPPTPAPAPVVEASVQAEAPPADGTIRVITRPAGAEVFEGEVSLGTAPLTIPHPGGTALPRVFELRREGYLDARITVREVSGEVVRDITLDALPPKKPVKAAPRPAAKKTEPAKSNPAPKSDPGILLTR